MSRVHHLAAVASGFALLAALHSTALAQAATPVAHLAMRADTTHHARATRPHRSRSKAALRAEAKVSEDSARAIALAQVPGGAVRSAEIEREKGKLIWSFDVKTPGKSGVEEVNVDAMTGGIVAREHESAAKEKKEARQEGKHEAKHEAKSEATPAAGMKATPAKPAAVRKP